MVKNRIYIENIKESKYPVLEREKKRSRLYSNKLLFNIATLHIKSFNC